MGKKDRIIIVLLIVWTFINAYILIRNNSINSYAPSDNEFGQTYETSAEFIFYPFASQKIYDYDYTEFFVYVVGAWLSLLIYKILYPKN